MGKRRRFYTSTPKKPRQIPKVDTKESDEPEEQTNNTARGRLRGALLEAVVESKGEESDGSLGDNSFLRQPRHKITTTTEEEVKPVQRQSYVLKLFDRSVDLSQFDDNTPLYPICRAWMYNQPKGDYKSMGRKSVEPNMDQGSIDLPDAEGPKVSKIPAPLPIQKQNKESINLNYEQAPPPSREQLLQSHMHRWSRVKLAWTDQAARVEARYEATQRVLNSMNVHSGI